MKYDHMVKINGRYYTAGEDVPEHTVPAEEEVSPPPFDYDIAFEERPEEKRYTRTDINRMSKAELQEVAMRAGVENAYSMTGNELKEYLLNAFGL